MLIKDHASFTGTALVQYRYRMQVFGSITVQFLAVGNDPQPILNTRSLVHQANIDSTCLEKANHEKARRRAPSRCLAQPAQALHSPLVVFLVSCVRDATQDALEVVHLCTSLVQYRYRMHVFGSTTVQFLERRLISQRCVRERCTNMLCFKKRDRCRLHNK